MATLTKDEIDSLFNKTFGTIAGDNTPLTTAPSPSPTSTLTPKPTPTPTPVATASDDIADLFGSIFDGSDVDTQAVEDLFGKAIESGLKQQKDLLSQSSSDLSSGAIIGIVCGCVGVVALIAAFVFRKRLAAQYKANFTGHEPENVSFVGAWSPHSSNKSTTDNRRGPGRAHRGSGTTTRTLTNHSALTSNTDNHRRTTTSDASILAAMSSAHGSVLWEDEAIVTARVPKDKVIMTSLISRGGYGEVYAGVYNGQPVAVKTLLADSKKNLKQINAFLSEVKLMAALDHERIVTFIGVAWDSLMDLCVVCELMDGGDLRGLLTKYADQHHPRGFDDDKIRIALHVAHALTYLHSLQPMVLHRDLKSKNILLDRELNAKVTDFGVSRERGDATMTANVGTSLWMAPEVMVGERYDEKSDIFSFGIVLSELDSHQMPYAETRESPSGHRIPDAAVLQMVVMGRMQVQWSAEASPEMVALGTACLALDAKARPTASEALYRLHVLLRDQRSGAVSGFV